MMTSEVSFPIYKDDKTMTFVTISFNPAIQVKEDKRSYFISADSINGIKFENKDLTDVSEEELKNYAKPWMSDDIYSLDYRVIRHLSMANEYLDELIKGKPKLDVLELSLLAKSHIGSAFNLLDKSQK